MKKYLLYILIGCLGMANWACQKVAQQVGHENASIEGKVISLMSGNPVSGATVNLCYHETMMVREGLFVGGISCDTSDIAAITNENGGFSLAAFADTTGLPTYVWVRVSHPDFESMHEVYIRLRLEKTILAPWPCVKKAYSPKTATNTCVKIRTTGSKRAK